MQTKKIQSKVQTMERQWRHLEKRRPNLAGIGRRGMKTISIAISKEIIYDNDMHKKPDNFNTSEKHAQESNR